jgi:hypothetical protein
MRRRLVLTLGLCLATLLIGAVGVTAQAPQQHDFGAPNRQTNYKPTLTTVEQARAQVDYGIPAPGWLPPATTALGAFFPTPSWDVIYPNAPAGARAEFAARNRLRPVGLLYQSGGKSFAIVRSSISVGLPLPGHNPRPYGLDQVAGDRVVNGNFEYVVRRNVPGHVFPGDARFPQTNLTIITWQTPGQLNRPHRLYDLKWTIIGDVPEDQLVQVARSFK